LGENNMKRTRLITARQSRGWSQEEAAGRIGVTKIAYQQWEAGKKAPYPINILKVTEVFGKSAEDLDLFASQEPWMGPCSASIAWADEPLTIYAQGIAACQSLYFGGNPYQVEAILPLYLARTVHLAQQPSSLQQAAAILASHAQRLACELATDREDFGVALQAGQQAFLYAQLAGDVNLQVAALINVANIGFHRKLSLAALQAYKHAVSLLDNEADKVTPLLKGRTYAGLAEVYAMRKDLQESMRVMGLAYEYYPEKPEDDPAYPYTRISRYALYVFGDVQSRLFLNQPKEADQALQVMQRENNDPEIEPITKLDMLYYQADIQAQQKDLTQSAAILTEAATLAKDLGSRLYFNKLSGTYHELQTQWPRETVVKGLEEVFQPW
jgi:transcriptional regulator with XRE-family HTH domain